MNPHRVDITPHPSLFSKLGATGYRTQEAIAELIDNSIDARLENQLLKIEVKLDFINKRIKITDNARGMTLDNLRDAMTLATTEKRQKRKLGFYGLGMKTSCSSLGKKFTIETKNESEKKAYICEYNESEWIDGEKTKWKTFPITERVENNNEHYTKITIDYLKVKLYKPLPGKFKKIFDTRYYPILKDKKIELFVNSLKCEPQEPEIIPGTKRDFRLKLSNNKEVTGWGALLKKRKGPDYGFNLYKNGRLIKMFDKSLFGREEHSAISMVIGELNLDHVDTMYNKTDFLRESEEFIELKSELQKYEKLKALIKEASEPKYQKEISDSLKDRVAQITSDLIINLQHLDNDKDEKTYSFRVGETKKIDSFKLDALGVEGNVNVSLGYIGNPYPKEIKVKHDLDVIINQNTPIYQSTKNKTFFIAEQIIEAIAYYIATKKKLNLDDYILLKDKLFVGISKEIKQKKTPSSREGKNEIKLANEKLLVAELEKLNNELKKQYNDEEYYFTATSVLAANLIHIPRVNYYFIYCDVGTGERIQNTIIEKFNKKFLVLLGPKTLNDTNVDNLLKNSDTSNIIIIREKEREKIYRRDGSVASVEIALVDLVFEIKKEGLPIPLSDVEDIISDFNAKSELKLKKIKRYATHRELNEFFREQFGEDYG